MGGGCFCLCRRFGSILSGWGERGRTPSLAGARRPSTRHLLHPDGWQSGFPAGADKQVILWEVDTGRALPLAGHHSRFTAWQSARMERAVSGDTRVL